MSHLFLLGGGKGEQATQFYKEFAASIPKGGRILYIPIAMPESKHTFGSCFDFIRSELAPFGITKIDMWINLVNRKLADLKNYAAVFIGGGNTFYLLKTMREAGFDKLLVKYYKQGGTLAGSSAGAVVLGKNILTAYFGSHPDKNLVDIKDFDCLNLAGNYAIATHYQFSDDAAIFDYVKRCKTNVIALSEEAGLHINKRKIKIIGTKNAYLFTKKDKHILKVDSTINF
jgi:dipeptidase E